MRHDSELLANQAGPQEGLDLAKICRHMSRKRGLANGFVREAEGKVKQWEAVWYEYRFVDGRERRRQRTKIVGKKSELTKREAEDKARELARGARPPERQATFTELAEWYLRTKEGQISKKWRSTLHGLFRNHILPSLGARLADEVKLGEVQQLVNQIASAEQSSSLVGKCLTHIRAVFELAVEEDRITKNPARKAKLPRLPKPSERFLELPECRRLLAVADRRERLILRLFLVCGLRPSELFALRVDDVLPGELRIDQAALPSEGLVDRTKTEESSASVPLPPTIEAEIRAWIRDEHLTELLFPSSADTPISHDNYLDRVLKPLGVKAGIDVFTGEDGQPNSSLNFQVLRRTTATHFQRHGEIKDTQALLRHTQPTTTLKHYQKMIEESLVRGVATWDAELSPKATKQQQAGKNGPGSPPAIMIGF
jgi:integrase